MIRRRESERPDREDDAMARLLDRVKMEDPPKDLKENVLRAIAARPEPARVRWLESLRAGLRRRLQVQLVPFAAGAAVGVVALALLTSRVGTRETGGGPMAGAMIPPASRSAATVVDDQSFELDGANVRLVVSRAGTQLVAAIETRGARDVAVTLRYAPRHLGVERVGQAASGGGQIAQAPGEVRIAHVSGGRADVVFRESGAGVAPIEVELRSGSAAVQGSLDTRDGTP